MAVGGAVLQAEAGREGVGHRTHQAQQTAVGAEAGALQLDAAFEVAARLARDDVHRAALRVAAEQSALRAAEHLDAFGIEEARVEADLRLVHAIDEEADRRLETAVEADAADGQVLVVRGRARTAGRREVEVRDPAVGLRDVGDALGLERRGVDHADRKRHVLERFGALAGRHDDLVQRDLGGVDRYRGGDCAGQQYAADGGSDDPGSMMACLHGCPSVWPLPAAA